MNAQEIFDTVVTHLRKQGCKSVNADGSRCMYRGENGTMCAAGCLIPDELYSAELEGKAWSQTQLAECRAHVGEEHNTLIHILQSMHDNASVGRWEDCFRTVAIDFNLTYTPPVV